MDLNFRSALATHGASLITHIGLVDSTGTELASTPYSRLAAGLSVDDDSINLDGDHVFDVDDGDEVAGWRAYDASTAGTNYGGHDFDPEDVVTFSNPGTFTLEGGALTGIDINAAS